MESLEVRIPEPGSARSGSLHLLGEAELRRRHLLEEALAGHFAAIACPVHAAALELSFQTSPSSLVATMRACCAATEAQVATHESCARELAAIHGLEIRWLHAA